MKYRPDTVAFRLSGPGHGRSLLACRTCGLLLLALGSFSRPAEAQSISDATALLREGKYDECAEMASAAIEKSPWYEAWRHLKLEAELARGNHAEARITLEPALERFSTSIRLRLIGHRVYRFNDQAENAQRMLQEIDELVRESQWRYNNSADKIALGRFYLLQGADAREVLELCYDRVKRNSPAFPETYLATGELGLDKHDYALAAEAFREAVRLTPDDPQAHYGLARSYASSEPAAAQAALSKALELNPRHVPSLLMVADRMIDSENYTDAAKTLQQILDVDPTQPEACAYQAVLAHLRGDADAERSWREKALSTWSANPGVDHLIGRKLSQNYRFAEGVQYQRRALDRDPGFVPARIQLSQDLLRWGEVAEGWQLAEQVNREDGYNVLAYNLVTLRGKLGDFKALEADGIVVRMQADEAEIYGYAALDLLRRAKRELEEKYDVQLDSTVTVEIYPEQKDFAIRTFGMPGGAGFLGVCFGPVITVNSPASQGQNPSNWQSVLWHEFCHAITLRKSRNKMPRWLSEGISVYEERQANPAWGQAMTPQYREMILGGELRPISQLSGAFLQPPSPAYLQFAYFASSLAVEHLVQEHGVDVLRRILDDLAEDVPINAALDRHAGGLEQLDQQFAEFARRRAEALAPQADWAKPELPEDPTPDALEAWVRDHPNSLVGLHLLALRAIEQQAWGTAQELLRKSLELYPEDAAADSAYRLLAQVYREQGDADQERAVLEQLAVLDADASDVYLRLAELYREAEDWESAARNAERLLAVNPLLPAPHRWLVEAADRLDTPQRAVQSYRALLRLDPIDPAGMHYRLARLLFEQGDRTQAKRHVLMALEAAPRYREAHGLLLQIADASEASAASPTAPETELEETP